MTGLPPSPSADLLSAAVSKLAGLHTRMDSLEEHVNSRLDERDRVVLAVADTIDRLTARMDSFEEGRTSATERGATATNVAVGGDDINFPAGGTDPESGLSVMPDTELFEQEPELKPTGPEPEYRHVPPPEYPEPVALEE